MERESQDTGPHTPITTAPVRRVLMCRSWRSSPLKEHGEEDREPYDRDHVGDDGHRVRDIDR
jgi:hypothetical protein